MLLESLLALTVIALIWVCFGMCVIYMIPAGRLGREFFIAGGAFQVVMH